MIDFGYVGEGLKILEGIELKGFVVLDKDRKVITDAVVISDNDTVKISVSGEAAIVQFAMIPNAKISLANLGNSEGLPAPGFEISK